MRASFYDSEEYRERQRQITKENGRRGVYAHLKKSEKRTCALPQCTVEFEVKPADPKKFCSRSCARKQTGVRTASPETRERIGAALRGRKAKGDRAKGNIRVPRDVRVCQNDWCDVTFSCERWKKRTFCSASCAAKRPTSPKASRGKSGIRPDISDTINFHSTWEANIARMYTHLGIEWIYEPKTFDIGGHTYTPDFYLPRYGEYLEVKNFWSPYSAERDAKFRQAYPGTYLRVLLKPEYSALQNLYGNEIPNWEFSGRS